jgi:uncharacterized protein YkwD
MNTAIFTLVIFLSLSLTSLVPSDTTCVSSEEQRLYELIMAYRRGKKLPSIPISAKLTQVAQTHAKDLSENYVKTDRCNFHSWSEKGNWSPCCYTSNHKEAKCMWSKPKEIAGYDGNGFEIAYWSSAGANAKEALDGWKTSTGHNSVIVNLGIWEKIKWKAIGIGISGQYGVVWFGEVADDQTSTKCH